MKAINKAIATLIDAMGMKSCNDERIANGLSAAYPDSKFTASAQNILDESIDWEQRRYELAKAAMQGYCANSLEYVVSSANHENISEWSVSTADAMIKRLKGGEEWHEFKSWYDGAKYGEQCIFRYEVLDNGVVISDYITAIWNDMTCDYLSDRISEYFEDYKITHWKPINKPKGVEK
jgi:hypothetical protein|nr:MAG TPA_asm: hypothetical protein [Caudoviricetes sp.]